MPSLSQSKRMRALKRRKERRARGELLLEGPRALSEIVEAGCPVTFVLYTRDAAKQPAGRLLLRRLEAAGVESERVTDDELMRHADTVTPRGWLAVAPIPRWKWPDLLTGHLLVLDGVQDPGNVGTLIRASEALGASGVIALPGTSDPWGPKAVRAAAGSSIRLPVLESTWDVARARLGDADIEVWAATADGAPVARPPGDVGRVALVIGNEGAGVSPPVLRDAARRVAVPMAGAVESLNAAIAGAILMDRVFGG